MMTTTLERPARKHAALVTAVYTFLLALGAAMPYAASYQDGLRADGEGRIECGGYTESSPAAEAERPAATAEAAPTSPRVSSIDRGALGC